MTGILPQFAETVREKFSMPFSGDPEDQLRAPFEALIRQFGASNNLAITPIGETRLEDNLGRPDYGIAVAGLLCGHVELKAPGKGADTAKFKGHDKHQWERFKGLPNILYTDGRHWTLYRSGEEIRSFILDGNPAKQGIMAVGAGDDDKLNLVINDFLNWKPVVPGTAKQLALYLAPLCRMLKDDVVDALRRGSPSMQSVARDWRNYLFPDADDKKFADSYAQTVTFALLLARSNGANTLLIDEAINSLSAKNTLLGRALQVLTDDQVLEDVKASVDMLKRVIREIPATTMTRGKRDPWLHFYEDFLQEYDPKLRKDAGAYYTPLSVVHAQVRLVDDILRNRMDKPMGFAEGGVTTLDPAVGTGTYLLAIIEEAMPRVIAEEGVGAGKARASLLAQNLFGFELMVGPYAVAALRMTRLLQDFGAGIPQDGVQIFLSNTLESPHERMPELPMMYQAIGKEHQRAKRVKETVPVLVCIGNPPYDRHEKATTANRMSTGAWVRWGEAKDKKEAIFNDFIDPVTHAGKGNQLKNLYNLYTYFWRWALWKVFEQPFAQTGGIVAFITASSFIDGEAFLGMRRMMRHLCDEIWIIDLGGDGRGTQQEENVFAIQTPVAITIAVRYEQAQPGKAAIVNYARIRGNRSQKLAALESIGKISDIEFEQCPSGWEAEMRPVDSTPAYFAWPNLDELMPWRHSGAQIKRSWPISAAPEVLARRWSALMENEGRAAAFKESRDRTVTSKLNAIDGAGTLKPIADLPSDAEIPTMVRYAFRSFDRQYLIWDNRLADYLRPALWQSRSSKQIFFSSLSTNTITTGPAITVSSDVPDLHCFRGSFGAKDVLPLYRDSAALYPNLHPELLGKLSVCFGKTVSPEDWAAYLYCITAQAGFTSKFATELAARSIRVPITTDLALFDRATEIGRCLLNLHTFGERYQARQTRLTGLAKCTKSIQGDEAVTSFGYDEATACLRIGSGEFRPVSPDVWSFQVSGMKVLSSWIANRMAIRPGKKSSVLDEIGPMCWTATMTTELLQLVWTLEQTLVYSSKQVELLDQIATSNVLLASEFSVVPAEWRKAPSSLGDQNELPLAS
ncbi:type ISP restriction/modification enzyme [Massilia aquatica]|uniref:site-specific DNA-methyltransferase (adenine-specific) n=1 Tax=Massilia aquatica TaxID=2609000 RepID=A0ABX0MEY0_9BURK|nr:type ISP restriction/modification enzyme [Massilia aquatica]NHZ43327.1 N-6 DNA methylase [Massilia aquatica]